MDQPDFDTRRVAERADEWQHVVVARTADPAQRDRAPMWWALGIAVAIHLAIFVALRDEIVHRSVEHAPSLTVDVIDWIPSEAVAPEPPMPEPPAHIAPVPLPKTIPSHPAPPPSAPISTMTEVPADEASAPMVHLYNADGTLSVPSDLARQIQAPKIVRIDDAPVADNTIMKHQRPLKVRPNYFDASWAASHSGNGIDQFVKNYLTKTTNVIRMPWGTRVQCGWIVVLVACGWGPPEVWHAPEPWKPATSLDEY